MPTDAKLGLLVGVGVVLAVAVMFFQKDPQSEPPPAAVIASSPKSSAAAVKPPAVQARSDKSLVPGRPVSRTAGDDPARPRDD